MCITHLFGNSISTVVLHDSLIDYLRCSSVSSQIAVSMVIGSRAVPHIGLKLHPKLSKRQTPPCPTLSHTYPQRPHPATIDGSTTVCLMLECTMATPTLKWPYVNLSLRTCRCPFSHPAIKVE